MNPLGCTLVTLVLLLRARPVATQFSPPFLPLNGLFATSAVRAKASEYRLSQRTATAEKEAADNQNVVLDIDFEHARDCIDHFGTCSVEDMERMRNALHAERISAFLTGSNDPAWPEVELQDRILEEDLSLQLSFLKEYIGEESSTTKELEIPGEQIPMPIRGGANADHPITIPTKFDVEAVQPDAAHTANKWLEDFAEQGLAAFVMQNGEAIALALTLMLIMLLPQAFHSGVL